MGDPPKMCSLCKHVRMYLRAEGRAATWFCTHEIVGSDKPIFPTHYCENFEENDVDPFDDEETGVQC